MDKETIYKLLLSKKNGDIDIKLPKCTEEIDIKILDTLSEIFKQNQSLENELCQVKNQLLEKSEISFKKQTEQLMNISTYKTNFLTNMSHELRTPLNSILVLSKMLIEDNNQNLTLDQLEYINTIYSSGNDLLNLINDILDLSKIEAGKMTIHPTIFSIYDLKTYLVQLFHPIALEKGLDYQFEISPDVNESIYSDRRKIEQILKNLLSNSFKFTHKGGVKVKVKNYIPEGDDQNYIKFLVIDTGIGIPVQKKEIIFEAFQQAENSISRKYGGTGLGLSISKQLSKLLNGSIQLEQTSSDGSIFSLIIPYQYQQVNDLKNFELVEYMRRYQKIQDINKKTKDSLQAGEQISLLFILEDDDDYSGKITDLVQVDQHQLLIARNGIEALEMINDSIPKYIVLDIILPDTSGWNIIYKVKNNKLTRHIPVVVISKIHNKYLSYHLGASSHVNKNDGLHLLKKALDKIIWQTNLPRQGVIIFGELDLQSHQQLDQILNHPKLTLDYISNFNEVLAKLKSDQYQALIIYNHIQMEIGYELLRQLNNTLEEFPIIFYSDQLTKEEAQLKKKFSSFNDNLIITYCSSHHQILYRLVSICSIEYSTLSPEQQIIYQDKPVITLKDQTILIVDDDPNNILSLSALLKSRESLVLLASSGFEAMDILKETEPNLIIMDIMMPEYNGYDVIKDIRKIPQYYTIPIIALTAKAMKGEREKCLEIGASDYISKPFDNQNIINTIQAWLNAT